jgi:hypothetical protein
VVVVGASVVVVVGASVVVVVGASVVVVVGASVVVVVGASVVVVVGASVVVVVGGGLGFVVVVVVGGTVVVVVVGNGSGSGNSWIGGADVVVVVESEEGRVEMTLGWVVTFPGFAVDEVVEREDVVVVDDFGLKIKILGTTVVVVVELGAPAVVGVLVAGLAGFVVGDGVATVVVGTAAVSDGWLEEWNGPLR